MADAEGIPSAPPTRSVWTRLPLVAVWAAALLPVVLWVVHGSDPELAVGIANAGKTWGWRLGLLGGAAALVAALFYPPFPAWLRRFVARTRTSWSIDRAPLLHALSELQHLETAQRHFEVGRLAWLRGDYQLCGPHLQRAIELDPSMPPAWHLFGLLLLRHGALQQALAACHNAERLDQGHAFGDALLHIARVQHLLGAHQLALDHFAEHAERHGASRRSQYRHGEALLAAGQRDQALERFREAAAPPGATRLNADENWFRAKARVRCWRIGGSA